MKSFRLWPEILGGAIGGAAGTAIILSLFSKVFTDAWWVY